MVVAAAALIGAALEWRREPDTEKLRGTGNAGYFPKEAKSRDSTWLNHRSDCRAQDRRIDLITTVDQQEPRSDSGPPRELFRQRRHRLGRHQGRQLRCIGLRVSG